MFWLNETECCCCCCGCCGCFPNGASNPPAPNEGNAPPPTAPPAATAAAPVFPKASVFAFGLLMAANAVVAFAVGKAGAYGAPNERFPAPCPKKGF